VHTSGVTRSLAGHRGTAVGLVLVVAWMAFALLAGGPARAEFREISMVDDDFQPASLTIRQGDTVVWVHRGQRSHGVKATDGSFESSPGCSFQNGTSCMRSGDRYSRTFDKPGTYSYFCPVHGSANGVGMAGQVTVASGSGGGTTTTARPTTTTTGSTGTTARPATTTAAPPPPPPPPGPPPPPREGGGGVGAATPPNPPPRWGHDFRPHHLNGWRDSAVDGTRGHDHRAAHTSLRADHHEPRGASRRRRR